MFAVLEIFYMYFYLGGINMCKNHQIVQLRKVLSAHFNVCVCVYCSITSVVSDSL